MPTSWPKCIVGSLHEKTNCQLAEVVRKSCQTVIGFDPLQFPHAIRGRNQCYDEDQTIWHGAIVVSASHDVALYSFRR